jgi:hypothetical protein
MVILEEVAEVGKYIPKIVTAPPAKQINLVTTLVEVAALSIGTYFAIKGIKKLVAKEKGKEEVKTASSLLNKLNRNPSTRQTLTDFQLQSFANGLFTAMDGYQTDEPYIYNVFSSMNNNADVLGLSKAYGIREISSGAWNPEPNFKGTLSGALVNELDTDELKHLNDILKKKGISLKI